MKIAPLAEVKARFSSYVEACEGSPVVVTKNAGRKWCWSRRQCYEGPVLEAKIDWSEYGWRFVYPDFSKVRRTPEPIRH
jgi:hypothetical protein